MNRLITCTLFLATLAGCVSSNSAAPVQAKTNSKPVDLSTPKLMENSVAELGDEMLVHEVGNFIVKEYKVIKTNDKLESSSVTKTPELNAGSIGAEATGKNGEFAACFDFVVCMYDKDRNNRFETITHSGSMVDLSADIGYSVETKIEEQMQPGYLKRTLIYQGTSNGKLKFKYREFTGTLARPAFDQDFEIELNKAGSTEFGFKGSRVEVYNATSTQISYKVSAYFK